MLFAFNQFWLRAFNTWSNFVCLNFFSSKSLWTHIKREWKIIESARPFFHVLFHSLFLSIVFLVPCVPLYLSNRMVCKISSNHTLISALIEMTLAWLLSILHFRQDKTNKKREKMVLNNRFGMNCLEYVERRISITNMRIESFVVDSIYLYDFKYEISPSSQFHHTTIFFYFPFVNASSKKICDRNHIFFAVDPLEFLFFQSGAHKLFSWRRQQLKRFFCSFSDYYDLR